MSQGQTISRADEGGTRTVREKAEKVTISYRGAHYQIGRSTSFYGIWAAGEPVTQPVAWWPVTGEGWAAAWSRFTAIEAPGSIAPAKRKVAPLGGRKIAPPGGRKIVPASISGRGRLIAAGMLGIGVLLGLIGLFPAYVGGTSLASQAQELVPHVLYLCGWLTSLALIVSGGSRRQIGALLGLGVSVVTFGLFLADLGEAVSLANPPAGEQLTGSAAGAGLVLALFGWLACSAGSVIALRTGKAGTLAAPRNNEIGYLVMVVLAGLGAALSFAPSWDSYTFHVALNGSASTMTQGYAFAAPGLTIAGNVIVMVVVVALAAAAVQWRPLRGGAVLLGGAIIPLAAQAISALIQQLSQSPADVAQQFGLSPAQVAQEGITISSGFTADFWVYCIFVVALGASCAWMLLTPDSATLRPLTGAAPVPAGPFAAPAPAGPFAAPVPAAAGAPAGTATGTSVDIPVAGSTPPAAGTAGTGLFAPYASAISPVAPVPATAAPSVAGPDTAVLATSAPAVSNPGAAGPDTAVLATSAPAASAPGVASPDTAVLGTSAPSPAAASPDTAVLATSGPAVADSSAASPEVLPEMLQMPAAETAQALDPAASVDSGLQRAQAARADSAPAEPGGGAAQESPAEQADEASSALADHDEPGEMHTGDGA